MADSRAPIVVGIRHTSSAITVAISSGDLRIIGERNEGHADQEKNQVSTASRAVRAISFGVFWRCALSTRAIIRSRNPSPGLAVTFTTTM